MFHGADFRYEVPSVDAHVLLLRVVVLLLDGRRRQSRLLPQQLDLLHFDRFSFANHIYDDIMTSSRLQGARFNRKDILPEILPNILPNSQFEKEDMYQLLICSYVAGVL